MLDTSAVIAWVELRHADLIHWLAESAGDGIPAIHAVTLGELERGVLEATEERTKAQRGDTLTFAREDLKVIPLQPGSGQAQLFGLVSSAVSRKLSNNDCWISAAALEADDILVTTDSRLDGQLQAAAGTGPLADWLTARGRTLSLKYFAR